MLTGDASDGFVAFGSFFLEESFLVAFLLAGGGGTDMSQPVAEAFDEGPKPQMILDCTDGWTPWPTEDGGIPVVACITSRLTDLPDCYKPPQWIVTLELKGASQ